MKGLFHESGADKTSPSLENGSASFYGLYGYNVLPDRVCGICGHLSLIITGHNFMKAEVAVVLIFHHSSVLFLYTGYLKEALVDKEQGKTIISLILISA